MTGGGGVARQHLHTNKARKNRKKQIAENTDLELSIVLCVAARGVTRAGTLLPALTNRGGHI